MPARLQPVHVVEDLPGDLGCEAERGLVEHDDLRLQDQRPAQEQHLLLAAGQDLGRPRAALAQDREHLEHLLDPPLDLLAVGQDVAAHADVLPDRHVGEQALVLRHEADAAAQDLVGAQACELLALERHAAAPRRQLAADHAQQRRLAGAVGADDAIAAVRLDAERKPGQDVGPGAIAGGHVHNLEQRHQAAPR